MRRQAILLLTVTWLMLGAVPSRQGHVWAADLGTLQAVSLSTSPTGQELVVQVDGPYSYKTVQADPETLFIDLAGAKVGSVTRSEHWANALFAGYKLLQYRDASGQPVVRIQVDTRHADPFVVQREGSRLCLLFGKTPPAAVTVAPAPAARAEKSAPGAVSASSRGPSLVSSVIFDERDSGETIVDVTTSGTVNYHVATLPNPARLVVDIEGARIASRKKTFMADTGVLKDVRIGQFSEKDPSVVRVVADLKGDPAFDVHATSTGIRLELRPRGTAKRPSSASHAAAKTPHPKAVESKTQETAATTPAPAGVVVTKDSAADLTTDVNGGNPAVAPPVPTEIRDAAKPDVQSTLPATPRSEQVTATPFAVAASATPEALRAEHAAQTLAPAKESAPAAAQAAPPANPPSAGPVEEKPVYTGEPISLNLKDVDLKDFFRLIHEISGLNIIIDPNVSGSVTLVLDSVPWDQALDIVLKNNRLGKVLEGNVLRIARVETLTAEQEATAKLADARINAAPLVTVFRPVNYAKASDIATLLKTWAGGGALSRRGTVLVDTRANTLIISDVQTQIPIIEDIITKLDKKAKQVSIEARVVLATASFSRTLATSLLGDFKNAATTTTINTGSSAAITIPTQVSTTTGQPILPSASGSGFGVAAVTNAGAQYTINSILTAAEERDEAKTISRPTIVTQNNVAGSVQQGVQVPVQTNINNTIAVTYENATLQMQVTPQVTDDNNIFLIINVNNASLGSVTTNVGPSINTQQANTQVLVPDGGTVIFGGVTVTNRSKSATYVPWLGSIPILGHLFKSSNVQDSDQELLFFVSPKILPG